jgi:hypothetical protein
VVCGQWLNLEYVHTCSGYFSVIQSFNQIVQHNRRPATNIDEESAALHMSELLGTKHSLSLRRLGDGNDNKVTTRKDGVQGFGPV